MVFLTTSLLVRNKGPDEFWRKRKIFQLAAHYIGKKRNCYSVTIKGVHRALVYCTKGRQLKKDDMRELWETRVTAATEEHGVNFRTLMEGLTRCNILLNKKILADLAVWEPRTFKSLTSVALARAQQDGFRKKTDTELENLSTVIISKGLIK